MLKRVIKAPINNFFEITPIGAIMNRFSTDIANFETDFPFTLDYLLNLVFNILIICIITIVAIPYTALPFVVSIVFFVWIFRYSLPAQREASKMESLS